ncbi:MAG: helix-turn-helix transcriptional regulator [Candidatus Saganbacteria bacterium]|nr:helix-turn-helix transcriptional regulator [Candidatus Saganbacteria bacterium]
MSNESLKKAVGRRITSLRKAKNLTIEKLAYENDLAKGNLSELEKGKINPQLTTLYRIAKGLDLSLKELLDID